MNGDISNAGISWRSFKLTQILQPTFTTPSHRVVVTVHTYGHKTKLLESLVCCSREGESEDKRCQRARGKKGDIERY